MATELVEQPRRELRVGLVLYGVIDASWQVFILIGGALAAFVIWLVLLGLSTRIRSD